MVVGTCLDWEMSQYFTLRLLLAFPTSFAKVRIFSFVCVWNWSHLEHSFRSKLWLLLLSNAIFSTVIVSVWFCQGSIILLYEWFSFLFWTLWLRVVVFHFFTVVGSYCLTLLRPSHSLEVVIIFRVRELQSVSRWTGWSSGLESSQASSPPPQGLGAGQAAYRCLWRLPGELEGELAPTWPSWWAILDIDRCPTEFLWSQLGWGTTYWGAGPGNTKDQWYMIHDLKDQVEAY